MTTQHDSVAARAPRHLHALLVVALAIPVLLFAYIAWESRQHALEAATERTRQIVGVLHEYALKVFETHDLILRQVDRWTTGRDWNEIARDERLQAVLRPALQQHGQIKSIWMIDAGGAVRAGGTAPLPRRNVADRDYFVAQRHRDAGTYISAPGVGRFSGTPFFAASRRRTTPAGEFDGVTMVSVDPNYFTRFWAGVIPRGLDAVVVMMRSDGVVLARYPALAEPWSRLPAGAPLMQAIARADEGDDVASPPPFDDGQRIHSYRKLAAFPVYVGFSVSRRAVLAHWRREVAWQAGFTLLTIVGLGMLGLVAVRRAGAQAAAEVRARASEERYRLLADHASDMIIRIGRDGVRRYVSPACRSLLGHPPTDLVGRPFGDFVHPEDAPRVRGVFEDVLGGLASASIVFRVRRRDGTWLWLEAIVSPYQVPVTGEIEVLGVLRDVTERVQAEERRRIDGERLKYALEAANDGVWDWDIESGEVYYSPRSQAMLGYGPGELEPHIRAWAASVAPEDFGAVKAALQRHLAGDTEAYEAEYRIRTKDGGRIWLLARGKVVRRDATGRPMRMVGTHTDVTQRKATEEALRRSETQLLHAQKMEALGRLAGGIAHDLNNTLVPVVALAKLLQAKLPEGSRERANLALIHQAGVRGRDLVRQILAFSRKEAPSKSAVDLAALVRETVAMLRATIPATIRIELALEPVPPLVADPGQLHQVLVNLVTNAAQAIGDRIGRIRIGLERKAGAAEAIRLSVSDSGCGMDETTRQRIFDPFFTTKPAGEGTGLGLSVVHGIVTSHGGVIEATSAPGEGARFDIDFPLADGTEADEGAAPAARQRVG